MSAAPPNGFHAGGRAAFHQAVEKDPDYKKKREAEKRQRIRDLLAERREQFQQARYSKRKAILKKIHSQVDREFSMIHCLF